VYMAINLDGGAPSQMLHKRDGVLHTSPHQYSATKQNVFVGNILSFMKTTAAFKLKGAAA